MIRLPGHRRAATWISALSLSLGVVGTLIVIEGSALRLRGVDVLVSVPIRTSVTDLAWSDHLQMGAATFWSRAPGPRGQFEYAAALIEPDHPVARPQLMWQDLKPRRVTMAGSQGRVALACENGALYVLESIVADSVRKLVGRHPEGEPEVLLCTADGGVLLSKGPDYLCAWDTESQRLRWPIAARSIHCLATHPETSVLLCARGYGHVEERDAYSGHVLREVAIPCGAIGNMAVLPGGRAVAAVTQSDEILVWRLDTGEPLWTASMMAAAPRSLSVSPDGRWIATGTLSGGKWRTFCFDAATGSRQELAMNFLAAIHGTRFTRHDRVLGWAADGSVQLCGREPLSEVTRWFPSQTAATR